jgi:uncharacterized protein (TIGR02246 family)
MASLVFIGWLVALTASQASTSASADETAVRAVVQQYVEAREAQSADALQKLFTDDADQLVSSGEWRRGRDAVVKGGLASSQQTGGKRALIVERVRFLAAAVALVDARYELTGLQGGSTRSMWATLVIVRDGSGWRITAIRNMLPAAPAK